ncbi:MAG: SDR family NAD(P)-dependent oxidoreductase [Thermodesulfobacteriota bacterium]
MEMKPIEEQIILVTGSTDGIGKITARKLAKMGAAVFVHGRSRDKCEATVQEIHQETGSEKLKYSVGDFSSLSPDSHRRREPQRSKITVAFQTSSCRTTSR